jgi:hypothetical protein
MFHQDGELVREYADVAISRAESVEEDRLEMVGIAHGSCHTATIVMAFALAGVGDLHPRVLWVLHFLSHGYSATFVGTHLPWMKSTRIT